MHVDRRQMLQVVCLCAGWCNVCAAYEPVFTAEGGSGGSLQWIDIEDESELIGNCEVEQFPTLLVFDAEHVYFAGPLRPDASTLRRVLVSCEERARDQDPALGVALEIRCLVRRILDRERTNRTASASIGRERESG